MAKFDTDELITTLKTRGLIPTSNTAFQNSDFLKILSDEIDLHLLPMIVAARADHLIQTSNISLVQGQSTYALPSRCAANGLRLVHVTDTNGNWRILPMIPPEALPAIGATTVETGNPKGYYLTGPILNIYPTPAQTNQWTVKLFWHYHPSRLVGTTAVVAIKSFTDGSPQTVVKTGIAPSNSIPASFLKNDADSNALKYDFVRGKPPFDIYLMDVAMSADPASPNMTFAAGTIPTTGPNVPVAGDYVCFSGETAIPNLPEVLHPIVAERAAAICLRASGDYAGAAELAKDIELKERQAAILLSPRSRGNARKFVGRNWLA